jgi:hypothetical protein
LEEEKSFSADLVIILRSLPGQGLKVNFDRRIGYENKMRLSTEKIIKFFQEEMKITNKLEVSVLIAGRNIG